MIYENTRNDPHERFSNKSLDHNLRNEGLNRINPLKDPSLRNESTYRVPLNLDSSGASKFGYGDDILKYIDLGGKFSNCLASKFRSYFLKKSSNFWNIFFSIKVNCEN